MKQLIVLIVICLGGWHIATSNKPATNSGEAMRTLNKSRLPIDSILMKGGKYIAVSDGVHFECNTRPSKWLILESNYLTCK